MEYFCTPCSKRKRRAAGTLPARERYLSRRIRHVLEQGRRHTRPVVILSGRYGLLEPNETIPWYDQPLTAESIDAITEVVARQLAAKGVTSLVLYALPRSTPGWAPYYSALERACVARNIALARRSLPEGMT